MNLKLFTGAGLLAAGFALAAVTLTRAEPGDKPRPAAAAAEEVRAAGEPTARAANDDVNTPATGARQMLGTYVGDFGGNKITVCLQNLVGETVNGYSVVAGNERAFSGALVENPRAFELQAHEPGTHGEDGNFVFLYHPDTRRLTGTWTPNDRQLAAKTFDLPRRAYRYDVKAGRYPQSSTRTLKVADVENLRPEELRIMRNEIYARHGYSFRLKDMRAHFDEQDWYMPVSNDVSAKLTSVEQKNEQLIKRYEAYGANYYDSFGR